MQVYMFLRVSLSFHLVVMIYDLISNVTNKKLFILVSISDSYSPIDIQFIYSFNLDNIFIFSGASTKALKYFHFLTNSSTTFFFFGFKVAIFLSF